MSVQVPFFEETESKPSTIAPRVAPIDDFDVEKFFEIFEVFGEAEAGVARLRQLIFDLAVRGVLVQHSSGSACDLVSRLAEQSGYPLDCRDAPFELPSGWAWSKLGALSSEIRYGYTASARAERQGVRLLRITDIQNDRVTWENVPGCEIDEDNVSRFELHEGDLVIARTGGTVGKTYLVESLPLRAVFASYLIRVAPLSPMLPGYLKVFSGSGLYWRQLYAGTAGTGQPNVNATTLKTLLVPVPPLTEQKRIVAKVDQLMALCDDLEARQTKKRELGTRLTKSALEALTTAGSSEEFDAAWKRVVENFDLLIERAAKLGELRRAILDQAVRGRLCTPTTEIADSFLTGLQQKRDELGRRGIRVFDAGVPVPAQDVPFVIPRNWRWLRLRDLGGFLGGGTPAKAKAALWTGTLPWVSPKDMKRPYIEDAEDHISMSAIEESSVKLIPARSVIYVVRGMILAHSFPVAVTTREVTINQDMKALVLAMPEISDFILLSCQAARSRVLAKVERSSHGTCRLESKLVEMLPIAVPPLAEQQEIVAKVRHLMGICDVLEAKLHRAEERAARLVEAVVQELVA